MAVDFESHILSSHDVRRIAEATRGKIDSEPRPFHVLAGGLHAESVYAPMKGELKYALKTSATGVRGDSHPLVQRFMSMARAVCRSKSLP